MTSFIFENKKNIKLLKLFIIILNIFGIGCLIYFIVPYLKHDMTIPNQSAMLASYSWDSCGFILTLGFIPLLISNIMAYLFIETGQKTLKKLFFILSLICFIVVIHYLFIATDWTKSEAEEPISTMKCSIDGKYYVYEIFLENNGEFALGIDDNDDLPLSEIDYSNKDTIIESIENYYKNNGGMCP